MLLRSSRSDSLTQPRNTEDEDAASCPTSTSLQQPFSTELPLSATILLRHVNTNAIADYYDIPPLRNHANTKIQNLLKTNWSPIRFSDVVSKVLHSTNDPTLHKLITSTAATHIEELLKDEGFTTSGVISDFALDIIRHTTAVNTVMEQALSQKLQGVQVRLSSLEVDQAYEVSLRESENDRMNRVMEEINSSLETLRETKQCRNSNCGSDFTCYIERHGSELQPKYTLRCARCQCRHKGN